MLGIDLCKHYIGFDRHVNRSDIMMHLKSQAHEGDIVLDPATTAWCAAWMNFCERTVGNLGTGRVNARSFLDYGRPVDLESAERGDIIIFDFEHDGVHGHVTYLDHRVELEDGAGGVVCLGGNQSDKVQYSTYGVVNLAGIRRP